jgi:hypothetical protein
MEHINITIEDGNVNIESNCTPESLMRATSVLFTSMVQNSSNTFEELLGILQQNTLQIIENSTLKILEREVITDEI